MPCDVSRLTRVYCLMHIKHLCKWCIITMWKADTLLLDVVCVTLLLPIMCFLAGARMFPCEEWILWTRFALNSVRLKVVQKPAPIGSFNLMLNCILCIWCATCVLFKIPLEWMGEQHVCIVKRLCVEQMNHSQ
jgi:hypothetical protein